MEIVSSETGTTTNGVTKRLHQATTFLDRVPRAVDAIRHRDIERIRNSFEVVL